MIINFILPGPGDSGGIKVVLRYAQLLIDRGNDVKVYIPIKAYNLGRYKSECINKIHQLYCTVKLLSKFKSSSYCKETIVKYVYKIDNQYIRNADVVIATAWCTTWDVAKLNGSKGVKWYFVQGFEVWDNSNIGLKSYKLPLKKIVISTWINNKLKDNFGESNYPIVLNGLDYEKFYNNNKNYKKKGDNLTCLMLNHDLPQKGVKYGIEAFEKAREKYPKLQLKMFGYNSSKNIPDYVSYIQSPSEEELLGIYRTADIFIFPSLEEGWGLTPIEAMACECAVVGTDTGFVLDLGKDGQNMLISKTADADGMARNILELANDEELMKKISINGRDTANNLNWEKSGDEFEGILRKN